MCDQTEDVCHALPQLLFYTMRLPSQPSPSLTCHAGSISNLIPYTGTKSAPASITSSESKLMLNSITASGEPVTPEFAYVT